MTLAVALTGGIGSGKSFVADCFAALGVPIIDADKLAYQHAQDTDVQKQIIYHFGSDILTDTQTIDRAKLRMRIFESPEDKAWLEDLLHPRILADIKAQIAALDAPYCVVVIPLLIEANLQADFDQVIVVDVPESVQIERTMHRDHCSRQQVEAIIVSQAPREQRLQVADHIIDNSVDKDVTRQQVIHLHKKLNLNHQ